MIACGSINPQVFFMENKIQILLIGSNEAIMATITRLVNQEISWQATTCLSTESAMEQLLKNDFALVLIGAGLDDENDLILKIKKVKPAQRIVKHFGGGSGLLFGEIKQALGLP